MMMTIVCPHPPEITGPATVVTVRVLVNTPAGGWGVHELFRKSPLFRISADRIVPVVRRMVPYAGPESRTRMGL